MSSMMQTDSSLSPSPASLSDSQMFVTMRIERQLIGIPVRFVRDVLRGQKVTPIPLSPPEVSGSLNLRGRIVTVIDVRRRLRLPQMDENAKYMFVVVDHKGELYSLLVDTVGDVLTAPSASIEKVPANLGGAWKEVASGIYKMSGELLVIVDVETLLKLRMH
ncbi:MAG: chemotaxis protein CheW [Rickettsiales bacterium]|jgi:purine-binding chemotaxis protein CheW|nr:chemotaxis protein CheW [Rickettsiales bacterium]